MKNVNLNELKESEQYKESMNEIKDYYQNSPSVSQATKKRIEEAGGYVIGNNGYAVGQTFTLTGNVAMRDYKVGDAKGKSPQAETTDGNWISIKAIMGLSSPRGYVFSGKLEACRKAEAEKKSKGTAYTSYEEVTADCDIPVEEYPSDNFSSRDLFEVYAACKANKEILEGATLTYHGIIARIAVAKKADTNGRHVGDEFIIQSRVWTLE